MRDGVVRRTIKRIALLRYNFDLRATRAIQGLGETPLYKLCGTCNQCGACCETPMVPVFTPFFYLKSIRWLIIKWHRLVNGFDFIGENRREKTFIFKCTHWDPETKLCDSYDSRPGMCRDYPRNLIYSVRPEFLEQCSYYAVDCNSERMAAALDDLELPQEELKELKRKLHVSETGDA